MRQFTLAAATVAIAALVAAAPASAERLMGGPNKQSGQCWKSHSGGGEFDLGRLDGLSAGREHPGHPARRASAHLILSGAQLPCGPAGHCGAVLASGRFGKGRPLP